MDIVDRLKASSCHENCMMSQAAKEIVRLRKIEEAAVNVVDTKQWSNMTDNIDALRIALGEE